ILRGAVLIGAQRGFERLDLLNAALHLANQISTAAIGCRGEGPERSVVGLRNRAEPEMRIVKAIGGNLAAAGRSLNSAANRAGAGGRRSEARQVNLWIELVDVVGFFGLELILIR